MQVPAYIVKGRVGINEQQKKRTAWSAVRRENIASQKNQRRATLQHLIDLINHALYV